MENELIEKLRSKLSLDELVTIVKDFHLAPEDIQAVSNISIDFINKAFDVIKAETDADKESMKESHKTYQEFIGLCKEVIKDPSAEQDLKKQAFEAAKEVTKQSLDNDNKRSYRNNKLRLGITTIATVVALLFLHGVGNKATKG
ncbi:hypothetical protein [Bacteroides congonensis]|uniref:hypothetical protein n=1 Tax=Bacteroides congonensis TaxID=1871006 RepID=UPI00189CC74E|nr:hypothetical protein [Bacteroides congonensis]